MKSKTWVECNINFMFKNGFKDDERCNRCHQEIFDFTEMSSMLLFLDIPYIDDICKGSVYGFICHRN